MSQFPLHDSISMAVYIAMIIVSVFLSISLVWLGRPETREQRRDRVSVIGIVLQAAGYATV
jgi:hypothetical protein